MKRPNRVSVALALVAALGFAFYGATKNGRVSVRDDFLVNNGSYLTNDTVHISIAAVTDIGVSIPPDTEILVFYAAATNAAPAAADWTELLPRLTLADFPHDYHLEGATNYNVAVYANFVPAPTVHTNGVWTVRGFALPERGAAFAFPNSKTETKED